MATKQLTFEVGVRTGTVSAILIKPRDARWLYVLAHGAGAGMRHPFLEGMAEKLAQRQVATFRYQFPYMESGRKSPDVPGRLVGTVRAAVRTASELAPDLELIAGGKSLGGRMTSTAAAGEPLGRVRGLAFLGFPLHPPNKPDIKRGDHLENVDVPMLFLQGTRDPFAELHLLEPLCERLGRHVTLHLVDGGDHSFHVPKRSGRTDDDAAMEMTEVIVSWLSQLENR
jgi:uncharacterized protein